MTSSSPAEPLPAVVTGQAATLITVAPTGAESDKAAVPALPVTLGELVGAAKQCRAAGAAVIHVHIRDDQARPTGGIHALADCSMAFSEGAINGLIGPNGSGKTTLFNVMTGYTRPDAGRVLLRGEEVTGARPD